MIVAEMTVLVPDTVMTANKAEDEYSNIPELGELNTLLNEVMPKQLINSPSAIDPASGIISSDVEDVSTYLHQCHHDNDTSVIQSFQMHPSQNHSYPSS